MTWAIVAVAAVTVVGSVYSASQSAKAAKEAAALEAAGGDRALAYQQEVERLPLQFRNEALSRLGGVAGLEGGTGSQQQLIDQAMDSPLYQQIMGNQKLGEESILRNASATGGLRSGDVQANLYDYNARLGNEALLTAYDEQRSGLQGLAGLGLNTNQIAGSMRGINQTLAAGDIAAAQANQVGFQNAASAAGAGANAYTAAYSDIRLKSDIQYEGVCNGHKVYSWTWNSRAKSLGLAGKSAGVMAHEIYETVPEAVVNLNGYIGVYMGMLGINGTTELMRA